MTYYALMLLQLIVAFGLLNVWLIRANWSTAYRGGSAKNIKEEFAVYGLPSWFCSLVGFLKISSALILIAGLWYPALILPSAAMITMLMVGAVAMHAKVGDPLTKTVPAALMLLMSLVIFTSRIG